MAVGGNHSLFSLGQSTAAGSAASSERIACLRANRAAAAGRLRPHPVPRAGRAAAASQARAWLGRGRRPATPPRPQANAAWCRPGARPGSARGSSAAPPPPQTREAAHGEGGTHRVSKSLHWPSDSGSAFTFVEPMDLPRTARACGRARRATSGKRSVDRAEAMERDRACTHAHPHSRDRHTDACGTGDCTLKTDAPHRGAPVCA